MLWCLSPSNSQEQTHTHNHTPVVYYRMENDWQFLCCLDDLFWQFHRFPSPSTTNKHTLFGTCLTTITEENCRYIVTNVLTRRWKSIENYFLTMNTQPSFHFARVNHSRHLHNFPTRVTRQGSCPNPCRCRCRRWWRKRSPHFGENREKTTWEGRSNQNFCFQQS